MTWVMIRSQIAGRHPQSFQFGRSGMRPLKLDFFARVQVMLMLLVLKPHFANNQARLEQWFSNIPAHGSHLEA